ncbi:Anti-sigma regulatory factor (Ser/Thr protein kinase) [Streptosporangium canum]|uniref:Anti-sigma regulatory factor (Ser/Thr protein kinase) n=1 Tax=Streptosporangium canum TaxID=324952 RepID=A0A1I4DTH2_9ACTN|nr:sensor histidine kinase [Streptosporangium canum]SFK95547.1 Anti-sigma regulatory factor (Ser/Thr protein kinase) [Streptosporangium canum]
MTTQVTGAERTAGLRHELYSYSGERQFLDGTLSFIEDALAADEVVLVSVPKSREQIIRAEPAGSDPRVVFMDVSTLGRNPARLIPAWQRWISERAEEGRPVRGIGETDWRGRGAAEIAELRYHEWLLNLAFTGSPAWWLLCPYDTDTVDPTTMRAISQCHPFVLEQGVHREYPDYVQEPFVWDDLEPACDPFEEFPYRRGDLAAVREKVSACAVPHGLQGERLRETMIAVTEVAGNSIAHGGGHGTLRTWVQGGTLVCEFHDDGVMTDPMIGRRLPSPRPLSGRGMWLVHQLCDLVQIRSAQGTGTTVRLHIVIAPV